MKQYYNSPYNSPYFIANKIVNDKPDQFETNKHCVYCKEIVTYDFGYQDREREDYHYCTCTKAIQYKDYKEELAKLRVQYNRKKRDLENKIKQL